VLIGALGRTAYVQPRPPPDSVYEDVEGGAFEAQRQARRRWCRCHLILVGHPMHAARKMRGPNPRVVSKAIGFDGGGKT
jgi:hypothetical protein